MMGWEGGWGSHSHNSSYGRSLLGEEECTLHSASGCEEAQGKERTLPQGVERRAPIRGLVHDGSCPEVDVVEGEVDEGWHIL